MAIRRTRKQGAPKTPRQGNSGRKAQEKAPYLQQALAHYGSRRRVEQWLRAGRIRVNGQIARPGQRLRDCDRISLDGRPLRARVPGQSRVLALYKPQGRICTRHDPQGRPTVYEILPQEGVRWLSVGRLDINSAGLLLFSDDGTLVQRLTHPGARIEREYAVRVLGQVTERKRMNMLNGVFLDGRKARFHSISPLGGGGANRWYRVVLLRGIQREVRRIWASQDLQVNRLIRIRYGNCLLPASRKSGDCWELSGRDLQGLLSLAGARRRVRARAR